MWNYLVASLWLTLVSCEQYCYTTGSGGFSSWGSKQTYETVRGYDVESSECIPGCEVQSFWSLHRHGTRYPKPGEAKQMKDLLIPLRDEILSNDKTQLCEEDLKALKDWKFNEDLINRANNLTDIGYDESYFTGRRFRKYLLDNDFTVHFRSTVDSWTKDSLRAIHDGMVDYDQSSTDRHFIIEKAQKQDKVLAPYDFCDAWNEYQKSSAKLEPDAFLKSDMFNSIKDRVTRRTGVKSISSDSIISMWEICRLYRVAFPNQPSPWCTVFRTADFEILEYYDDMFQYYFAGYGSDLNAKLGCHTLKNLINTFRDTVENNDGKMATVYVAHLTITEMVMSALGIGKDSIELNTKNADKLLKHRNYRTNNLQPYGVNFAAVLYKCTNQYFVQIYHNENIVKIQNKELLSWNEFLNYFNKYNNCSLSYCK